MTVILLRKILKYCAINTDSIDRIAHSHKFSELTVIRKCYNKGVCIYIYKTMS